MANAEVGSAVTVMGSEPAQVSVAPVRPGAQPKDVLDHSLMGPRHGRHGQPLDAVVLDAEEWGFEGVIDWVRRFHEAYLERQAESAPEAWMDALQPTRTVPPVLVVATPPGLDQHRIAAAGAIVYEKPSSASLDQVTGRLRQELAEAYSRFEAGELGFSPAGQTELEEPRAGQEPALEPSDLEAYADPVYRLSDEDFEALLDRGRTEDPLEVGE